MSRSHKIIVVGTLLVLLFVILASQLYAQSPTATPAATPTVATTTPTSDTQAPSTITTLTTRQAVVKNPIDGDTVEVLFTDDGESVTVHLANVDTPEFAKNTECFGRESSAYVTQVLRNNPLISISLTGEIHEGEVFGYVELPDGTLLNKLVVLFGYAKFDDQVEGAFTFNIKDAEQQSRRGEVGLWRFCGATEQPPPPCFLFSQGNLDSASQRDFFAEYPDTLQLNAYFKNASFDPVQHELVVVWSIAINDTLSGWRMKEFYRLSDCARDRSEIFAPSR